MRLLTKKKKNEALKRMLANAIIDGMPYSLYFKYIKVIGNKFDKEK